jgi:hypothetical protein
VTDKGIEEQQSFFSGQADAKLRELHHLGIVGKRNSHLLVHFATEGLPSCFVTVA